jgi:hypothetical protein
VEARAVEKTDNISTRFSVVSRGEKRYFLTFVGNQIFLENEFEEMLDMPPENLYDILNDYFQEQF